jgi:hypothetical protein
MPGLESSGYEGFRDKKKKKLLISCFGLHVTNCRTHNLSTRTGNFMRKSVIITGFLTDDVDGEEEEEEEEE